MIRSMVDKPQFPESKPPVTGNTPAGQTPPKKFHSWEAKPMRWLGMQFTADQAKQLWNIMEQNIGREIQKQQDRAVKAIKKMNPDNNEDS